MITLALQLWLVAARYFGLVGASDSTPMGCLPGGALAEAVRRVAAQDWSKVSRTSLRQLWPTQLVDWGSCQRVTPELLFLRDEGRIVAGNCECCELFEFVPADAKGESGGLRALIVGRWASNRTQLLRLAEDLSRAVGLARFDWRREAAQGVTRDQSSPMTFSWRPAEADFLNTLEVEISSVNAGWSLRIELSRSTFKGANRN